MGKKAVLFRPLLSASLLVCFRMFTLAGPVETRYAEGHVLVRFHAQALNSLTKAGRLNALEDLTVQLELPAGCRFRETTFQRWQRQNQSIPSPTTWERQFYLELPPDWSVEDCLRHLQGHPWIDYVEPDHFIQGALLTPGDPGFSQQWHHLNSISNGTLRADIHTPEAWTITRGSTNVLVGLLDSGLNAGLAEFAGRVVPGFNFVSGNTNTMDDHFHGTAIASLLAANGDNDLGVAGVDWHCRLMPIKVLNHQDAGLASWYADGLDWAREHGCKVVNLSFADAAPSETVRRAITNAIASGVIVVALADNGGWPNATFPGNLTNVITVGSTDRRDRWAVSNYGAEIDLVAPGADMTFLHLDGSITSGSGNSASAPLVSGVVALLASVRPDLNQETAWTLLAAGADDGVGDALDTPGFDVHYGWGRLNAENSLILARSKIESAEITPEGDLLLAWECPPNGSRKRPYRVQWAPSPTGPWQRVEATTPIEYQGRTAVCLLTQQNTTERFYRLEVVVE